jgi:hypothetical protein
MARRRRDPARRERSAAPVILLGAVGLALALAAANFAYQVWRKPAELWALAGGPAPRTPRGTWAAYGASFRVHATDVMSPYLLAALAQQESAGDPLALPAWRWQWTLDPFRIYAPASSAAGMLQLTDAAFAEARQLCVHRGRVARAGRWYDLEACWFNALYTRALASHAIEMTSAWLTVLVGDTLRAARAERAGPTERQRLAATLHLCGPRAGLALARRGFRLLPDERCGAHALGPYLARIETLVRQFERLDRGGPIADTR